MSAAQRIQQHPLFVQAQKKALYYNDQLDKEVPLAAPVPPHIR